MLKFNKPFNPFPSGKYTNVFSRGLAVFLAFSVFPFALSGCVSDTGVEPYRASKEELEAASAAAGRNKLRIGCWLPPRPHQMTTDEEAEARMKEVAESGLNMVSTHHDDLKDMGFIHRIIKAGAKYGVEVMIELNSDLSDSGIEANLNVVRETKDYANLFGYNLFDEPGESAREALTGEYALVKELAPDKFVMLNLLPNYGPQDAMAPVITKGLTWYRTYVDNFAQTGSEAISFDSYPYRSVGEYEAWSRFISNSCDLVLASRKYDRPVWGFVQDSSWSGMYMPEEEALRMLCHMHLLFQMKSYSYFLYAQPWEDDGSGFSAMLNWDGKLTRTYYRVQKNNAELANFGYRVLSYDLKGIYAERLTKEHRDAVDKSLRLTSGSCFKSVDVEDGHEIIAGIFTPRSAEANARDGYANDTADEAVYVINFSHSVRKTVTVNFKGVREYTVWGPDGIEDMGAASSLKLDLPAGDARFIEFKTFGTDG
ncbi:MAG: beta-galactosidase [Clostridia bacterium]|nr:beta-galactosidase [Clostridia bacterium]